MPAELARQLETASADEMVEIWPDMVPAVSIFFQMETQWQWVGAGMAGAHRVGLNYASLPSVAAAIGVTVTAETISDLRCLEGGALEHWARKK